MSFNIDCFHIKSGRVWQRAQFHICDVSMFFLGLWFFMFLDLLLLLSPGENLCTEPTCTLCNITMRISNLHLISVNHRRWSSFIEMEQNSLSMRSYNAHESWVWETEYKLSLKYLESNYVSSLKSFFVAHNMTSVWIAKSSCHLCGRINSVSNLVACNKKKYGHVICILYSNRKSKVPNEAFVIP